MTQSPQPGEILTLESVKLLKAGDVVRHPDGRTGTFVGLQADGGVHIQASKHGFWTFWLEDQITFIGRPGADGWMRHDGGPNPFGDANVCVQTRGPVRENTGIGASDADWWPVVTHFRLAAPSVERDLGSSADADTHRATDGAVLAFGHGRFVIDTGSYNQTPAVFICPVDEPGKVGASARKLGHDRHTLLPGEMVLTFPFFEQAQTVADAMVTVPPPAIASGTVGMERGNAVRNEPKTASDIAFEAVTEGLIDPEPDVAAARERLERTADVFSTAGPAHYEMSADLRLILSAYDRQGEEADHLRCDLAQMKAETDAKVREQGEEIERLRDALQEILTADIHHEGDDVDNYDPSSERPFSSRTFIGPCGLIAKRVLRARQEGQNNE